jgi:hypothetical protein
VSVLITACARSSPAAGANAPPPPSPAPATAATSASQQADPGVNATAEMIAEFQKRVKDYMDLHQKAASGLPGPNKDASPAEVVAAQRQIEARIVPMRKGAKPGDIFVPEMQTFVRSYLAQLFKGPDGAKLKGVVMDENPVDVKYGINSRYPDSVPLSTMPAQVLKALPKLPDGLEYRFIGRDLILFDVRAHIVVDFIPKVLPV